MLKKLSIFGLVFFLFLGGCAMTQESRYNRIKSKYPGWDEETVREVADRQVSVGMTKEMVLAALGTPSLKENGHWRYFTYKVDSQGYTHVASTYSVYFQNDEVINEGSSYRHRRGRWK